MSMSLFDHGSVGETRAMDDSPEVDIAYPPPVFFFHIAHFGNEANASVVEHGVEATIGGDGGFDDVLDGFGVCHVDGDGVGAMVGSCERSSHRLRFREVDVGNEDDGVPLTPFFTERPPDA